MQMTPHDEIAVIYEKGVLRPERALDIPEQTRLMAKLRELGVDGLDEVRGKRILEDLWQRGSLDFGNWRPTRDELHERD